MEKELLEKILARAFKLLSKRPQSEWEIKTKLKRFFQRRKIKDQEIYLQEALKYLQRENYLHDEKFARWFLVQRTQFRPRSKKGLFFELKQKGVSEEIINQVLADYNEEAACEKLIEKKARLSQEKLTSYLLRQGFPPELISRLTQD